MNKKPIAVLFLLAIVAVAIVAAGCGGFPADSPAKVGDVYIDGAAFISQVEGQAATYGITLESDPDTYALIQNQVMEFLIENELALQKASALGITADESEVQEMVDQIKDYYFGGDEAQFEEALQTESLTVDEFTQQVRDSILVEKVTSEVTKDIAQPTDEEIAAYYDANKDSFLTDQMVEARHIFVAVGGKTVRSSATTTTEATTATTETTATTAAADSSTTTESTTTTTLSETEWAQALATAAQIRADLLGGGSWSRLAARYSGDLDTKNDGGALGAVAPGALIDTLGQEFDNALFSLDEGQISEPIKTETGYEIIQVVRIVEPQPQSLEEASGAIAGVLLANAQDQAWQTFIAEARAEIGVVYSPKFQTTTTTAQDTPTTLAPSDQTTTVEP